MTAHCVRQLCGVKTDKAFYDCQINWVFIKSLFTKFNRSRCSACFSTTVSITQKVMETRKPVRLYIFTKYFGVYIMVHPFSLSILFDFLNWYILIGKRKKIQELLPGLVGPFSSCLKNTLFPSAENWNLLLLIWTAYEICHF